VVACARGCPRSGDPALVPSSYADLPAMPRRCVIFASPPCRAESDLDEGELEDVDGDVEEEDDEEEGW